MRVVLPAPFSPSRAWISPGWTSRSIPSLATTPGYRFVTSGDGNPLIANTCELGTPGWVTALSSRPPRGGALQTGYMMSRRMWMARVLPAALAVAVLVGSSVTVGLHLLSARANSHAASAQMHWPAIDHKAEQQYWALRNGNMTGAALQAAEAQAAKLPQTSKLPPTNHVGGSSTGGMTPGNPGGAWTGICLSPIDTGGRRPITPGASPRWQWTRRPQAPARRSISAARAAAYGRPSITASVGDH